MEMLDSVFSCVETNGWICAATVRAIMNDLLDSLIKHHYSVLAPICHRFSKVVENLLLVLDTGRLNTLSIGTEVLSTGNDRPCTSCHLLVLSSARGGNGDTPRFGERWCPATLRDPR